MLRTVLLQLRAQPGRLLASGLAVVLGTAFVAAALTLGASLRATLEDAVAAEHAVTDVVVTGDLTDADLAALRALPGAALVEGRRTAAVEVEGRYVTARTAPVDRRLQWQDLAAGRLPTAAGEVALPEGTAARLSVRTGDVLELGTDDATGGSDRTEQARVVGLLGAGSPRDLGTAYLLASPADTTRWAAGSPSSGAVLLARSGTSADDLARAAQAVLPQDARARTAQEQTAVAVQEATGGVAQVSGSLLAFATVALFVAALVIANTFSILVVQRTRETGLLRCLGATGGQVRRGVLLEALVLGLVASAVGALAGCGLVAAGALVLRTQGLPLQPVLDVPALALAVPLLLGTVVTALAALVPAARATRTAPLAALRPSAAPVVRSRAGVLRLALAALLAVGGGALLAAGAVLHVLVLGLLGGVVSFLGVLLGVTVLVPGAVRLLAGTAGRLGGVPARLAGANAVRNPGRTAATATALLVGSTLVAMMTVGAASARSSLGAELGSALPVDLSVSVDERGLSPQVQERLARLDGVAATAPVTSAVLPLGPLPGVPADTELYVQGVDVERATDVLRGDRLLEGVADGTVVLPAVLLDTYAPQGGRLRLGGQDVQVRLGQADSPQTTTAQLARLAPDAAVTTVWLRLAEGADVDAVVRDVDQAVAGVPGAVVTGDAAEREAFDRLLDTLLLVALGLLAVAVVIAVVGVANTLSLSELERRRETALLRALGLTRGQVRQLLAVEAVLVAVVGALLGAVLGTLYGWAGVAALLGGGVDELRLAAPVGSLALLAGAAVLAGLVASWLPGRRAARTSPVLVTGT